jgi:hypothetical protein
MAEKTKLDFYFYYSEKAGDIARNLAFVGFAVIWIFHVELSGRDIIPRTLLGSAIFLALSLIFDLTQYVLSASYWGLCTLKDADLKLDLRASKPGTVTLWLLICKFCFVFTAYAILIYYLIYHVWVFKTDPA